MDKIARDIYRAIHTGSWLRIEYINKEGGETRYWIGIKKINCRSHILTADGLNVATRQMTELTIRYDGIQSTDIVDGTYYETDPALIRDIREHPAKYAWLFRGTANLKILDYYIDCNKLDVSPEQVKWGLIDDLDIETLGRGAYHLSPEQYAAIIKNYNLRKASKRAEAGGWMISLCMNVASLHVKGGLFILAYREVLLDVGNRTLRQSPDITLCSEFTVDGEQYHIDRFLSEEHQHLLKDFAANEDEIKNIIDRENPEFGGIDDMPYLMAIGRKFTMGLEKDYSAILEMMEKDRAPVPLQAFFGSLTQKPHSFKQLPLAFFNDQVNVDQLNALYKGIRSPLLYVQGPPGTGKTNTILNMVLSLFFNEKTVLISSYNNHPMDEIFQKLQTLESDSLQIPFPVVRLGNNDKVRASTAQIRKAYELALNAPEELVFGSQEPDQEPDSKKARHDRLSKESRDDMRRLGQILSRHEKRQDELERKDMLETTISSSSNLMLLADMQGRQLKKVNRRLKAHEAITEEEISKLTSGDRAELRRLLMASSVRRLRQLERPKYKELRKILFEEEYTSEKTAMALNEYLSQEENMRGFLRIFPVVITTNSSAYKLGPPKQYFDMTIIDEASQCSTATSLLAVLRSRQLMLVGDPQQLKPVVQLDAAADLRLREKYNVPAEYDYIDHSAYETFLAVDPVSDEILLRYHYRCHPKIIAFNNRKYYNSRLEIRSVPTDEEPLHFIECRAFGCSRRNSCESEVIEIIDYIRSHPDEQIGVITPFANQSDLIRRALRSEHIIGISSGTVHAFQGDERQVILFSLALSARTGPGTYGWLRNNRELLNVATSRAREKLVMIGDPNHLRRLHHETQGLGNAGSRTGAGSGGSVSGAASGSSGSASAATSGSSGSGSAATFGSSGSASDNSFRDDLYELYEYICSNGEYTVSEIEPESRALGIKPYDQKTEDELLANLNHALQSLPLSADQCEIRTDLPAVDVLNEVIDAETAGSSGADKADSIEKAGQANKPDLNDRADQTDKAGQAEVRKPFGGYRPGQMRSLARDLYYQKTFDYVVYETRASLHRDAGAISPAAAIQGGRYASPDDPLNCDTLSAVPIFAIELERLGSEMDETTAARDSRFLDLLDFQCIRVPSNYIRRYQYLKDILSDYFNHAGGR